MILIKNAILVDSSDNHNNICDVKIENNIISQIGQNLEASENFKIIDGANKYILPGFIDIHCHLRDMEQSLSEDICSGTKAAARGGYTHVVSMANTQPVIDCVEIFLKYQNLINSKSLINVLPIASLTKMLLGNELVEIYQLIKAGAIGFSDDGKPYHNKKLLYNALLLTRNESTIIISHAEDINLSSAGDINSSHSAFKLGLNAIPTSSEASTIASEIEIVRETKSKIHFSHVSLSQSLKLIENAKADGLEVTCDVTPHHLCLDDSCILNYNSSFKMNPPLRSKADSESLIQYIKSGVVDCIGTDHAPHSTNLKNCGFSSAAFGVTALETAFSLCFEKLVINNLLPISKLLALFNDNPADILKIKKNSIIKGAKANLVIFDPVKKWHLTENFSKSSNSPFVNRQFYGKVIATICDGEIVYQ